MVNCGFLTFISILACTIAKDKTVEEISILSAFLLNFGDTLATLAVLPSNQTQKDTNDEE